VTQQTLALKNAHLDGEAFYWEGGPVGVLLSHGFTATSAEVRLLGKYLHERGYTVAGPLLPGHGTTIEEMNRCRWGDWARSMEETYQQLASRCQRVVVGGESMGGLLALYLAAEHPEAAAVLAYAAALRSTSKPMQLATSLLAPFVSYRTWPPGPKTLVDERWQGYPARPLKAALQLFRLQKEVSRRLPSIHQPALIMQGCLDRSVFPDVPAELAQRIGSQDKEVHWLEKSEHCLLLDQEWEQAAEITARFLERVLSK
jgi:carboxylesterase